MRKADYIGFGGPDLVQKEKGLYSHVGSRSVCGNTMTGIGCGGEEGRKCFVPRTKY